VFDTEVDIAITGLALLKTSSESKGFIICKGSYGRAVKS
jgi:hypothetical protein